MTKIRVSLFAGLVSLIMGGSAYAAPYVAPSDFTFTDSANSKHLLSSVMRNDQKDSVSGYVDPGVTPATPWAGSDMSIVLGFNNWDTQNINRDTWQVGGRTWGNIFMMKATCQTYSEGDEGGVCFEFDNMNGPSGWHRNGAGSQDGINVGFGNENNGPIFMVGGNGVTKKSDGTYTVTGNVTTTVGDTHVGATAITVKGPVSCGNPNTNQYCDITSSGAYFGDGTTSKVTVLTDYDPASDQTVLQLPKGISVLIPSGTPLTWKVYASDGIAYGVVIPNQNTALVYPHLSDTLYATIRGRMSVYTNISHGFKSHENTNTNLSGPTRNFATGYVDLPNYYYGFLSCNSTQTDHSMLCVESDQYPGTGTHGYSFRTFSDYGILPYGGNSSTQITVSLKCARGTSDCVLNAGFPELYKWTKNTISGTGVPNGTTATWYVDTTHNWTHIVLSNPLTRDVSVGTSFTMTQTDANNGTAYGPGNMVGDSYDYRMKYTDPSGVSHYGTNHHNYPAPALFFGLNNKMFNTYWVTEYNKNPDAILREYDNEYDFWTGGSHAGETSSRGATYVWTGGNPMADGSWMMRLAGTNLMPLGLMVDGVFPNGGVNIATDSGFFVIRDRDTRPSNDASKPYAISMLGMGATSDSEFHQLGFFEEQDDGTNAAYHLGLIKSNSNNLMYNVDPNCSACAAEGQIIWNANGVAGVGFGYGIGGNYKPGLYVDSNGATSVNSVGPVTSSQTLYAIQHSAHSEGQQVWCHDCRAPGDAPGAGTGRWIYLDTTNGWRTQDGILATK